MWVSAGVGSDLSCGSKKGASPLLLKWCSGSWSSRKAHNLEIAGSNPATATN